MAPTFRTIETQTLNALTCLSMYEQGTTLTDMLGWV